MLDGIINTRIISHPVNWIIVILILSIFGLGAETVIHYFKLSQPKNGA